MKQSIAYGMEKAKAPFIILSCEGHDFYFLIDTGSTDNHLIAYGYEYLKKYFPNSLSDMQKDTSYSTAGVGGEFECVTCEFSFDLGTERHKDVFGILPSSEVFFRISQLLDSPVCGILGNKFLAEHGIVIDYGSQMIYTKRNYNTKKKAATLQ